MVLGFYNHHLAPKLGGVGPAVSVHSISFEAPYFETWPTKSYRSLFASAKPKTDLASTKKVIHEFMNRAFRKTVPENEVTKYVNFWQSIKGDYERYEDSVAEVFIAILCSPEFIYIAEPPANKTAKLVDDYQLANRLSFLLWNRGPDAEVLKAASSGDLSKNLDKHIDRLLADQRSKGFIQAFGTQWLKMDRFQNIDLDKSLKSKFNPHIRAYMIEETHTFLQHILDNNMSIKNFIDSDFVMLNEHLADYYGIKDIHGHKFRPVKLDRNLNRGGLLSQGSFLVGHSDGKQSHPIKRGVWLMEKIMATEPPPPPPNVPEIDETIPGFEKMSMAQKLEVHRDKASCRDCHAKIDPWGLAFEEYDALGIFHKDGKKNKQTNDRRKKESVITVKLPKALKIDGVRLGIPGENKTLNISEVEVYSKGKNIARHSVATQSSLLGGYKASFLIDRNKKNFAHSKERDTNPWFKLTFKTPSEVEEVKIYNRKGYESRFNGGIIEFMQGKKVIAKMAADGSVQQAPSSSPTAGSQIAILKKKILEEKMHLVTLSVVEHLLGYSLGRELSYLDEDDVHELVKQAEKEDYRFKDIVKSIIKHEIFRRL